MKKGILVLSVLVLVVGSVSALYYEKGDGIFSIRAGVSFPALTHFPNKGETYRWFYTGKDNGEDTGLKLGGEAFLSYQAFLTRKVALGGELGYCFNASRDKDFMYTTIPLTVKFSVFPVQTGRFDLVFNLNAGACFNRFDDYRKINPIAMVSVNPQFYISDSWGLGLELGCWANFETYPKSKANYENNCIALFLPATIAVTYRH
ncbi:MAG: hypothetical protein MJ052_03590 [Sphaerochaetaceae bacterium]|nr:hypothetical protein [Sphaerochaetaceae bacterium]